MWLEAHLRAQEWSGTAETAKAHLLHEMGEAQRMVFPDGYQLQRRRVHRRGYTVADKEFIDARFSKVKDSDE